MPRSLTSGAEPFAAAVCPRCDRPLRLSESLRLRAVRCPGCGAALTAAQVLLPVATPPPAPPPAAVEGVPSEGRPSWPARAALPAPALLALGIPLWTRGGVPGMGLAAGLALGCILVGLWSRWRPAVRLLLTLLLMGLGYGVAFAVLVPDEPDGMPSMEAPGTWPMASPPFMPKTGFMGPFFPHHAANVQPVNDLTFRFRIGELLAVAADPAVGAAFVTRADGSLDLYSYPDFRLQAKFRLEQPAYRAVLDGRRGRLYLAVSDPAALHLTRYGDRPEGRGDLHIHDVRALLASRIEKAPAARGGQRPEQASRERQRPEEILRPAAVVSLGGDVSRLLLPPDRGSVYYLVHRPDGDRVGRLPASSLGGEVPPLPAGEPAPTRADGSVTALALAPDGAALYAAGPGAIRVLDPRTLAVRRTIAVEPTAADLTADNDGRLFLTERGQWTTVTVVDARQGEVLGHWSPRLHGRIYLQVTPDATRLYMGTSSLVSNALRGWLVLRPGGGIPPQYSHALGDSTGPVRGEFFLTPDSLHLVNRYGKVFRLTPPPDQRAPFSAGQT